MCVDGLTDGLSVLSESETDSVVGDIEVSVELVNEGITKNEGIL